MVKQRAILIILVIIFLWVPSTLNADNRKVVTIGGDENYPPYEYVDRDGDYKGFNVDVMKAIANAEGIDIRLKPMEWSEALDALDAGRIDVIQGMSKSIQRNEKFDFSGPLISNSQVIFVRNETTNIVEPKDLAGHTVAIQSGDINSEIVKQIKGIMISPYDNQEQAMDALLLGEVDAFVGNKLTGTFVLQNMRQYNRVKIVGEPLSVTSYCSAVKNGNAQLLTLLNKGLDTIKEDGTYDLLYDKWFGKAISYDGLERSRLMILGIFLLTFFAASLSLVLHDMKNIRNSSLWIPGRVHQLKSKLLENVSEGVIACNKNGRVIVINETAGRLLGFDLKELDCIEQLALRHSAIHEGCIKAMGGELWQSHVKPSSGNQDIQELLCRAFPVKNKNEKMEGIILILQDHTEGMLLVQEKEYNKLKTEFFANVSHEFRTPLSVIYAAVQLLQLNSYGENLEKLKGTVEKTTQTIRQNINRLTKLIDNIIDATKADNGFIQLQLANYNIVNIIEEAAMSVVELAGSKGLTVEFDTEMEEKVIACDADKIERVILNLLSNSIKFTEPGGSIFVRIFDEKEAISIQVKDTGIGIPIEQQKAVFERFRQITKTSIKNHQGSGIGLYLVKSLVELHGGKIDLISSPGIGSEFNIRLPINRMNDAISTLGADVFNTKQVEIEFSDIYL